jgi:hypothetical protein
MRYPMSVIVLVISCCLPGCQVRTTALWGSETERDGTVTKYGVHGYSSGEPITVVLVHYQRGAANAPAFQWSHSSQPDVFRVAGKVIPPAKGITLYVNAADGTARAIKVDESKLTELFRNGADPSWDRLLEFWDKTVQPALAGS